MRALGLLSLSLAVVVIGLAVTPVGGVGVAWAQMPSAAPMLLTQPTLEQLAAATDSLRQFVANAGIDAGRVQVGLGQNQLVVYADPKFADALWKTPLEITPPAPGLQTYPTLVRAPLRYWWARPRLAPGLVLAQPVLVIVIYAVFPDGGYVPIVIVVSPQLWPGWWLPVYPVPPLYGWTGYALPAEFTILSEEETVIWGAGPEGVGWDVQASARYASFSLVAFSDFIGRLGGSFGAEAGAVRVSYGRYGMVLSLGSTQFINADMLLRSRLGWPQVCVLDPMDASGFLAGAGFPIGLVGPFAGGPVVWAEYPLLWGPQPIRLVVVTGGGWQELSPWVSQRGTWGGAGMGGWTWPGPAEEVPGMGFRVEQVTITLLQKQPPVQPGAAYHDVYLVTGTLVNEAGSQLNAVRLTAVATSPSGGYATGVGTVYGVGVGVSKPFSVQVTDYTGRLGEDGLGKVRVTVRVSALFPQQVEPSRNRNP